MTTCADVAARLSQYAADTLEAAEARGVREHLEGCADCRRAARSEAALHDGLVRATAAPELDVDRLLARARSRHQAEARPSLWRRALLAATLLMVVGVGLMVGLGPPCLRGDCPTARRMLEALTLTPSAGEAPPALGVPQVPGLLAMGAAQLPPSAGGLPVAFFERGATRLLVFRDAGSGTMSDPGAHTHFWQTSRLADGREYVEMSRDGHRVIGWVDATGRVWCCVGVDREQAFALASAVRQAAS